jgi:CRP-like cAMP-binding protein
MSLAAAARDVPLMEGRTLVGESDSAVICVVVQGEVRLEREARDDVVAGPGSTIGMLETLAGVSLAARAVVARTGRALWLEQEEMFDVLADHVDLVQSLFSALRDTPATLAASGSVRSGAAIH